MIDTIKITLFIAQCQCNLNLMDLGIKSTCSTHRFKKNRKPLKFKRKLSVTAFLWNNISIYGTGKINVINTIKPVKPELCLARRAKWIEFLHAIKNTHIKWLKRIPLQTVLCTLNINSFAFKWLELGPSLRSQRGTIKGLNSLDQILFFLLFQ